MKEMQNRKYPFIKLVFLSIFLSFYLVSVNAFADVIIDNRASETSYTGTWSVSGASAQYGTDSVWSRDGATFTWHFVAPQTSDYELLMWWTQWPSRSSSVPVEIVHEGGTDTVYINQTANGGQWNTLGEYAFEAGQNYRVTITSQPGPSSTCADAVRFLPIFETPTDTIIDNRNVSATSQTGTWGVSGASAPYGTDSVWSRDGATFTWFFSPAQTSHYEMLMWWTQWPSRSSSVPVEIVHEGGTDTVYIDQTANGGQWNSLGSYFFEFGKSYTITITSQPGPSSTCADAVRFVGIEGSLSADFTANPLSGITPLTVQFTDTSTGVVDNWSWDLNGDGTEDSTVENPSYTYTEAGTYKVSLTVTGSGVSDTETKTAYISVSEKTPTPPTADFTANPLNGTTPLTVQFTDTSTGVVDSWSWDLDGDGTEDSTVENPSYTYTEAGDYTVSLTVTGSGVSDTETKTAYISVSETTPTPPTADFTANPLSGTTPLTVQFTDTSTGAMDTWAWDFENDGVVDSTLQNPIHTYNEIGTYTVSLMVSGLEGESTEVKNNYVDVTEAAIYDVIIDNRDSETSQNGTWGVSGAPNPYGTDSVWSRDGTTFTWNFNSPQTGRYEMMMWWTVAASRSNNVPVEIEHAGGITEVIIDQSTKGGQWNSLGGFVFESGNNYRITITSRPGPLSTCADAVRFISSEGTPDADFTAKRVSGIAPLTVQFTDTSTGTVNSWAWDFDNNGTVDSNERDPSYTYGTPGTYSVKLTVNGFYGSDEKTKTDYIRITDAIAEEKIYICWVFPNGHYEVRNMLIDIGAYQEADVWRYDNVEQNKSYVIHMVYDVAGIIEALKTEGAHVIIRGHSNYGMGYTPSTQQENLQGYINDIYFIDDDRILNVSSKTFDVSISGMINNQAYPNWLPIFQDSTSGIMPYGFNDKRGNPPFNYYLTYTVPGDSTHYKIETARGSALQRFPGSGGLPWYSIDGAFPDPDMKDDIPYFIIPRGYFETTGAWSTASSISGYYSTNYHYVNSGSGNQSAAWLFKPPKSGNYVVYAWWPASSNNTSAADFTVRHKFGSNNYKLDQRVNGGRWNIINEFSFDQDQYSVVLSNNSVSGNVIADAVRIRHVDNSVDIIIDNSNSPYYHYGSRTILFRKVDEISKDELKYSRLFLDTCTSGIRYLDTFNRGIVFYTTGTVGALAALPYLKNYMVHGFSDYELWRQSQLIQPLYDYYDFNKYPWDQP